MNEPNHRQVLLRAYNEIFDSLDGTLKGSGLIFGIDYDGVSDTTAGLVQTILLKLGAVTVQTITITYTDECKDQYNLVVS